ncbi:MAG: polyphosphate kinase 1 [Bdellovibrionaceae bacterium]|nr:polyphosphate kinase 1 [Pseudobdellovibrionaceae bacterium]
MESFEGREPQKKERPIKKTNPQRIEDRKPRVIPQRFLPTIPSLLSTPNIPLIHRDVSWLQFNERVLEQARPSSKNLPVERVKFLAISASNLDEFFMIRMASLMREIAVGKTQSSKLSHLTRIRDVLLENVVKFTARQVEILDLLAAELQKIGIHIVTNLDDDEELKAMGSRLFETAVLPHLKAPTTFSPQSLKELDNLEMAVIFPDGLWYRVPRNLPPVLSAGDGKDSKIYFFFLDHILQTFLARAFRSQGAPAVVRVTRDADVTTDLIEEGTAPTPDVIRGCLNSRDRGAMMRLQYLGNISPELMEACTKELNLAPGQVLPAPTSLCLQGLWSVVDVFSKGKIKKKLRRKVVYPPLKAHTPEIFKHPKTIFERLSQRDYLLHHPYDSFQAFVSWIEAACKDPKVSLVEITAYRFGTLSPIIPVLKKAAKEKCVRLLIELRARFDEGNNLLIAEELSQAGVQVGFGFGKLKLHAKVALVARKENGVERYYTHLSTGNYNAKTAKQYTDLAIFTSNQEIGLDARNFFDAVWKGEIPTGFKKLVLAPTNLHRRLIALIQAEIKAATQGKKARIVAKMNALVDDQVIAHLYRASQFGVQVDLIVRGACSLIPKVEGLSDNIRVISIIDRFLEHSRFYYFQSSREMYLSSADWMPRNFFRRLEIAFPVLDERILSYLEKVVIPTHLKDTEKARELTPQGTWKKTVSKYGRPPVRAQFVFADLAARQYRGTSLE